MEQISDGAGETFFPIIDDMPADAGVSYGMDGFVDTGFVQGLDQGGYDSYEADLAYAISKTVAETLVDLPPVIELKKMTPFEEQAAIKCADFFIEVGHYNNENGVDTDRAARFLAALGFTTQGEHLIVEDAHKAEIYKALHVVGIPGKFIQRAEEADPWGMYLPMIGTTVVYRGDRSDSTTESVYQHEQAHSTAGVSNDTGEKHIFIEEGFARWVQATYDTEFGLTLDIRQAEGEHVSRKYRADHVYNFGAMTWDVLFHAQPDLLDAVIDLRTNRSRLVDVAGMINSLRPGLFNTLLNVPTYEGPRASERTMHAVMDAADVSASELPEICDNGEGVWRVAKKLAAYKARYNYQFPGE
jgi:hypothetical protein